MAGDPSVMTYSPNGWLVLWSISAATGLFVVKSPYAAWHYCSDWQNMVKRNTGEREEPRETFFLTLEDGICLTDTISFFCTLTVINYFNETQGSGSRFCFHLQAMGPQAGAFLAWRQKQNRLPERRASLLNYTMDKVQKRRLCQGFFLFFTIPMSHNRYERFYRISLFF